MLEIQSSSRGNKNFLYLYNKKNFIFILCLKSIGRYRLYLPIPILLADTTKIGRYHRYRYSSIGTSLIKTSLLVLVFIELFSVNFTPSTIYIYLYIYIYTIYNKSGKTVSKELNENSEH